jgi:predicted AlkP superfamily phosphohydrolase/phosphomutase
VPLNPARTARCALTLVVALVCASSASSKVILIGVDGASWSVLDPLLAAGRLPHLAALAARGVTAELETVEPVRSPVVCSSA